MKILPHPQKQMSVKGTTEVYAIFGHPVSHSFSPAMHNAAIAALGLDAVYVPFDVRPEELESAARAVRAMGIRGVNVTIPHKHRIIPFLDEVSAEVSLTGALNTIKNEGGRLRGFNTDVGGFMRALAEDLNIRPKGLTVTLLGAGGAARAVISGLAAASVSEIFILNRTLARASALAAQFAPHFRGVSIKALWQEDGDSIRECLGKSHLLVNSTSAGMKGAGSLEIPIECLPRSAAVYDLVYNPRETALVKAARDLGIRASGGLSMLIYQGAESFEIWTGRSAPVEIMRSVIE
ncbi:MAG: shikimate dehydrogenase [Deltaproteobacteria bacterium]